MRTPLVLAVLTVVALCDLDSIVEKRSTVEEVFQLRSKRCSKFNCEENEDMSNALRHVFLAAHNIMRESISRGTEVAKSGLLPRSANMYKLNWNCDLEVQAREWTRKCDKLEAEHAGQGQNFVIIDNFNGDVANTIVKQIGEWRKQILTAEIADQIKYDSASGIQQWANMANGETTEIGCSVHKCGTTSLSLSCFYNKAGDVPDKIIYEQGEPCSYDYDCSKHADSYCVPLTGMCHLRKKNGEEVEGICPLNAKMSDAARHTVLDWHNALRSNLAFGKEEDGEGAYAPMAKGMLKMHYDCVLEATAQAAVERCRYAPYKLGKTGENIFMTEQQSTRHDQITLLQAATRQWWDELRQGGLGYNNTFSRKELVNHVEHFTQMAWSVTYRVGCATNVCGGKHFAVCHYSPSGNKFGQKIYSFGSPCKAREDCDGGQTCAAEEGLCVVALE